ncbi:hypothetical protein BDV93DRAFT_609819 [Ceratobasidium sp. AG-I]|nr:hypothetical protein BDV93DRAFT_609819 [Ceratobasidium sp. AG-I]
MQELLVFLPSLIHVALLLFAIGLSIYLWNIHFGVALPVLCITAIALSFYTLSTLLPLLYNFCPYTTTLSRLIGQLSRAFFPEINSTRSEENPKQDEVTSRALHWLIVNCEVPSSVDVALQALAGATETLPKELLEKCDAAMLICRRLTASSSYVGDYKLSISLYTRALAFLRSEFQRSKQTDSRPVENTGLGRLEVMVWQMQSKNERDVVNRLGFGNFAPTPPNLNALRIGSTAASHCLKMFNNKQSDPTVIELATSLLEQHLQGDVDLHPAALLSLVKATEMLFSCGIPPAESHQLAHYPMRLVRTLSARAHSRKAAYYLGIMLSAHALAQRDYPGWRLKSPLDRGSRAERAIEMIEYHASLTKKASKNATSALLLFGLLELLRYCEPDNVADVDYNMILSTSVPLLRRLTSRWTEYVHTIPWPWSNYILEQQISDILALGMFPALGQPRVAAVAQNEGRVGAYLELLRARPPNPPSVQIYAFVVESLCRVHESELKRICSNLLMLFDVGALSEDGLVEVLRSRKILVLLLGTAVNAITRDPRTSLFAMSQLWQLTRRILLSGSSLERTVITEMFPSLTRRHGTARVLDSVMTKGFQEKWLPIIKELPVTAYKDIQESNVLKLMLQDYPDSRDVRVTYASVLLQKIFFSNEVRRSYQAELFRLKAKKFQTRVTPGVLALTRPPDQENSIPRV